MASGAVRGSARRPAQSAAVRSASKRSGSSGCIPPSTRPAPQVSAASLPREAPAAGVHRAQGGDELAEVAGELRRVGESAGCRDLTLEPRLHRPVQRVRRAGLADRQRDGHRRPRRTPRAPSSRTPRCAAMTRCRHPLRAAESEPRGRSPMRKIALTVPLPGTRVMVSSRHCGNCSPTRRRTRLVVDVELVVVHLHLTRV